MLGGNIANDHVDLFHRIRKRPSDDAQYYERLSDYIALTGQPISDSLGNTLAQYSDFSLAVNVQYDSDLNEATNNDGVAFKRITIEVTSPLGQVYGFSAYKGNY